MVLSTTGTLPAGLSPGTYYIIRVSATTVKLATSRGNADDGTAVNITAASGGGVHTMTLTVNATSRSVGDEGGEELHTLQTEELASHEHNSYNPGGIDDRADTGGTNSKTGGNPAGGDVPHNNMPPYVTLNYIIKT